MLLSQTAMFDEPFGTLNMRNDMVADATLKAQTQCDNAGFNLCVKNDESVVDDTRVNCASVDFGANMQVTFRGYHTR